MFSAVPPRQADQSISVFEALHGTKRPREPHIPPVPTCRCTRTSPELKGWITTAFDHTSGKDIASKLIICLWNKILPFAYVTHGDYWIFSFIHLGVLDELDEFLCILYTFAAISTTKKWETWKFSAKRNNLLNQHKWVKDLQCNWHKIPS